eukprot:CAMPEP_0202031680 /NCGR_PEP_ID=MMETSP0905-20130828/65139_1 /ASSEMBLY_ACC=CAM_ASM_000554 /TAXON_ID=420261 /ORGANISM="Thalassiosira antarctica, Strain CCMP982" /LENGTH=152 /DNA_ID=CAMNT_0048595527 /DNA_START=128 /DNA_END=587 /DNA_ORIENTATION=-
MGLTLGMLDTKEGAAMRNTVEKRKIRQANTKASRKRAVLMSLGATNGLASSMVFTPVQGLELVNPDAAMGLTLGMLDTKEGAAMRNTVEKRKIRQANTKASRKRAVLMSLGATNGLAAAWSHARAGLGAGESRCQWGTCSTQADTKWFSEDA